MLSVFFLDFFEVFLGVSETEPAGELLLEPSLLQDGRGKKEILSKNNFYNRKENAHEIHLCN